MISNKKIENGKKTNLTSAKKIIIDSTEQTLKFQYKVIA